MKETQPNTSIPNPEDVVLPEKKKRVKKRFTTREQIVARIDKFTAKATRKRDLQRMAYSEAGQLRRVAVGDESLIRKAVRKDADGDKLGLQADRLEKDVLGSLKRKLAEFDTETIPGMGVDRSVPQ